MNGAVSLQEMGQSVWLDNLTGGMLDDGTLARCRRELAVTGLTSNPTIYEHALAGTALAVNSEALFFSLALEWNALLKLADGKRAAPAQQAPGELLIHAPPTERPV